MFTDDGLIDVLSDEEPVIDIETFYSEYEPLIFDGQEVPF